MQSVHFLLMSKILEGKEAWVLPYECHSRVAGQLSVVVLKVLGNFGGDGGIRTPDRVIMIHLLCRLSYIAIWRKKRKNRISIIYPSGLGNDSVRELGTG